MIVLRKYILLFFAAVLICSCNRRPQGQLLEVTPTGEGSNAVAVLWIDGKKVFTTDCFIGRDGTGKTREGDMKTPSDTMHILGAFGILPNPGTSMPYIDVTPSVFACGDREYYNLVIDTAELHHPNCNGEDMYHIRPHYNYGLITDYNRERIYMKGGAIFIHCKGTNPYTAGCVALDEDKMRELLVRCDTTLRVFVHSLD